MSKERRVIIYPVFFILIMYVIFVMERIIKDDIEYNEWRYEQYIKLASAIKRNADEGFYVGRIEKAIMTAIDYRGVSK